MSVTVLVADDHSVVRRGIVATLNADPSIAVVGEAEDGEQAVAMAQELDPDVVLMDLRMPRMGGAEATAKLVAQGAQPDRPRVLVFSTYDTDVDISRALEAGARGFLLKETPPSDLIEAVRLVAADKPVYSATIAQRLDGDGAIVALSSREQEVVSLAAEGLTNSAIGSKITVSEATVKFHLQNIYRKLGVQDRGAMVYQATKLGWLA